NSDTSTASGASDKKDAAPVAEPTKENKEQLTVTAPVTPSAPDPLLSQPTNTGDFSGEQDSLMSNGAEVPDDIKALENRLQSAETQFGEERSKAEGLGEPGEGLPPSDKFDRVPLRPPMSDSNWLRWAGPMAQKEYKIRRGDSLWAVSDRLFGNPYLWPKIWHLNARITNPHIIERGMTLSFNPGNPGSAPELAFRPDADDVNNTTVYPLTKLDKKKTLLEMIDETLREQISESHPPFHHFLLDHKPAVVAKVPSLSGHSGRVFYVEGDRFRLNIGDGIYPVVKVEETTKNFVHGYKVHWTGLIKVEDKQAEITKAFSEIEVGDELVQRRFQLSPLAIHKDTIGPEYREETKLVPVDNAVQGNAGAGQMMGILFPGIGLGPRPGALLEIQVGSNKKVQALLVDRDERFGTLWVIEGDQEATFDDQVF
ncbi:MAG: LysM peptidoglycan-binding domain-containing protein, partial [Bdellovibrionota bacterium]